MKRRAIVEVISAIREQDTRPTCYIDTLKDGSVTFGVRTSAATLKAAREKAVAEFRQLVKDVEDMKSETLIRQMGHSVK